MTVDKPDKPKHQAKIYLFPIGHGGRAGPYVTDKARLGIVFEGGDPELQFGAEFHSDDGDDIGLGEFIHCNVLVMNDVDAAEFIVAGGGLKLFEGAKLIGIGIWTKTDSS